MFACELRGSGLASFPEWPNIPPNIAGRPSASGEGRGGGGRPRIWDTTASDRIEQKTDLMQCAVDTFEDLRAHQSPALVAVAVEHVNISSAKLVERNAKSTMNMFVVTCCSLSTRQCSMDVGAVGVPWFLKQ